MVPCFKEFTGEGAKRQGRRMGQWSMHQAQTVFQVFADACCVLYHLQQKLGPVSLTFLVLLFRKSVLIVCSCFPLDAL